MSNVMLLALILWIAIHFTGGIIAASQESSLEKELTFTIEHSFQSVFSPRTRIHIVRNTTSGKQSLLFPERNGIFEKKQLLHFAEKLELDDLYSIKIQSHSGNYSSPPIVSSIPACELQKSGFKEDLLVYLDSKKNIVGVSYSTPPATIKRDCDAAKFKESVSFQTRLKIADRVTAQVVPIHAVGAIHPMFKDVKLEAAIEGEAPVKVPQTLFERYWLYGVFAVVYMIINAVLAPKEKQQRRAD